VDAVRKLVKEGVPSDQIDESAIASRLYVPDLPDPDLIIRTAGESRVSNFLLWQSAYSELLVTETLWPDFGVEELKAAIADYNSRIRRFGGRPEHELAAGNASR
jgi:undecaprenyl diphosphate synthase